MIGTTSVPSLCRNNAQEGPHGKVTYCIAPASEVGPFRGSRSAPIGTPSKNEFVEVIQGFLMFRVGVLLRCWFTAKHAIEGSCSYTGLASVSRPAVGQTLQTHSGRRSVRSRRPASF